MKAIKFIKYHILILLVLLPVIGYNQVPVSIQLTEKNGAPDTEIYDILEDRNGYIWLAADKGLFRYDGRAYKSFTNDEKRGKSVFHLHEDAEGKIWCTNLSGQYFYVQNDSLITFIDLLSQLKGDLGLYQIIEGNLYVYNFNKTLSISLTSKEINFVSDMGRVAWCGPDPDLLFLSSEERIYQFQKNGITKIVDYSLISKTEDANNRLESIPQLIFTKQDTILFHEKEIGLAVYEIQNMQAIKSSLFQEIRDRKLVKIVPINSDYWICTDKGVHVYDKDFEWKASYFDDIFITDVIID
ncbi:MAG: two-component regulator propeller domain-containing protein [Bacteroidota bacterium]